MAKTKTTRGPKKNHQPESYYKIMQALETLLEEKGFNEIKWSDIANTAGVNEGLIYRYYKEKKNILFTLFQRAIEEQIKRVEFGLKGIDGTFNKIRKYIWIQTYVTCKKPVGARIQFLEARAHNSFFKSSAYQSAREYVAILRRVIQVGIENGEIRDDIPINDIIRIIMGAMEQSILPVILFGKATTEQDVDRLTDNICKVLFPGLRPT